MGFQTPLYELSEYLQWTNSGKIQLPDFQRGYKWDDDRIRSLLVSILRGHPLGIVMLLKTGNDQVRFKPKPLEGTGIAPGTEPDLLLLDGQQRLTSLTQALTGTGIVHTKDARGKLMDRRYYVDMKLATEGEDRIDEAVIAVPGDGIRRTNFGRDIELDLSTPEKERAAGHFPVCLLFSNDAMSWLLDFDDRELGTGFNSRIIKPALTYNIPAIELDTSTSKSAVATVFEKVNTGGLELNVFELLTATFAGDKAYFEANKTDFRLNDDWQVTQKIFAAHPTLAGIKNTDFLQAVTLLATRERNLADTSPKPPAISARRDDVLKLTLADYLKWVGPLREAFAWTATFLANRNIFAEKFIPYPTQLVPLAVIKVIMGGDADLLGPSERIGQWFWSGILGELYGSAVETRFVRDIEQVPDWARDKPGVAIPRTVQEATFVESRLHSLRTRNAAAYKGIYALLLGNGARDWQTDSHLDKVQYASLNVDIHHIFPRKWCDEHAIDSEHRESIINKTAIAAETNRSIGGAAPSSYLTAVERKSGASASHVDGLVEGHLICAAHLRADAFDLFFADRRERLCALAEQAMGKPVQRDLASGHDGETSAQFEEAMVAETVEEED